MLPSCSVTLATRALPVMSETPLGTVPENLKDDESRTWAPTLAAPQTHSDDILARILAGPQ